MRLVAIISSFLLACAVFLPWQLSDGAAGINFGEGRITLGIGLICLAGGIYQQFSRKEIGGILYIIFSLLFFSLLAYMLGKGGLWLTFISALTSVEAIGLTLAVLSALVLLIAGIYLEANKNDMVDQGPVAGFVANRIAFNQQRSFSRFIIRLSIVATVISVAVMIITLAFANGFQETVAQKVFSFWGHIRIQEKQPSRSLIAEEIPIIKNDSLADIIRHHPGVRSIHPFATKYAMLKTKEDIEGLLVKGLDSTYDFNYFESFMDEGRPIKFNDTSYSREIMISAYTAKQLKLKLNDRLLVYFIRRNGKLRPDRLTITGIYKTGIEEYDKTLAIADIKLIQQLNKAPAGDSIDEIMYEEGMGAKDGWTEEHIGGYEIFLDDYTNINTVVDELYELEEFPLTWDTRSARDISPNIFDWLNMQDLTRDVLIGFMIIVAVINLISCLIILVLERLRMIGILKALGATNWTVQKIFLRHSAIITITGILVGAALGLGLLFLQKATGFIKLKEEAYYMSEAAVKIVWWQVGAICAGTLLVCFLILTIPSLLVRKIQPVKAIEFR